MDEDGGHGGDQFHRNEAISAVADDGFLAEEDEDYEDLYNDVNVGEGFRQSLQKNELSEVKNDAVEEKKLPPPPPLPLPPPPPLTAQNAGGVSLPGAGGVVENRVSGFQNQGFTGNEVGVQGGGIRVELGQKATTLSGIGEQGGNTGVGLQGIIGQQQQPPLAVGGFVGGVGNDGLMRQGQGGGVGGGNGGAGGGSTILFVGDLHWWTTDADLEAELCKYGQVKDVRFFDEKASGKSKGYCQVEFYDPLATTACKEGMNGHLLNGRPCVVSYANPFTVKKMGEALNNRNQPMNQTVGANQGRRGPVEAGGVKTGGGNVGTGGNYQGGDGNNNNNNNNNRGSGRGNWGRGNNPGMGNRGHVNSMRNRGGGMGGRGMIGNAGNGYGQGIGAVPPMMHNQTMMNQGFDPSFGGPMGRVGGYAGFPGGPAPPFSGIMSSYPGMHGVAPHVNPAFYGRGMHMNAIGMIPPSGMDGPNMGMWPDPNMGGWGGDELGGGKVAESSYGEEAASDHQYGEVNPDRAGWPNAMREKDRGSERDWSGTSERKFKDDRDHEYEREAPREKDVGHDYEERRNRDDREMGRERSRDRDRARSRDHDRDRERGRERDRNREDRDKYADHRYKDRDSPHDDEWERGRSSRTRSKSRLSTHEEEHHSRKESDYGKRRRLTSD